MRTVHGTDIPAAAKLIPLCCWQQMILDANKGTFGWWVTPPINPRFRVYIWNYTNWDEYTKDRSIKIKLKEIGPFTYR